MAKAWDCTVSAPFEAPFDDGEAHRPPDHLVVVRIALALDQLLEWLRASQAHAGHR